ncbi:winged helix-turn-helix transcriptional regulator [Starkeya sp. ORNL1]|uniref:ArsR/SmtB family transcription factor n=1 Tax=Starkeya sp. ORNL1 TaxID=2709380 RepID=UPI001463DA14|nr:metalloregulator ArsR/SmtB family transcription factor [Starkeya sp. ORNL1]QJP13635.1 winged helix-turn-helix transcriptional regulator [Starkeya sp. ORNL1]
MTDTPDTDDLLALRLRALGHPARLAILRALARAEKCQCGEIVRGLPLAQSTVSQHLKVLKEAGLITGTIDGPRSCYCLDRAVCAELAAALGPLLGEWAAPLANRPTDPNCRQTASASVPDRQSMPDPHPSLMSGKRISA